VKMFVCRESDQADLAAPLRDALALLDSDHPVPPVPGNQSDEAQPLSEVKAGERS